MMDAGTLSSPPGEELMRTPKVAPGRRGMTRGMSRETRWESTAGDGAAGEGWSHDFADEGDGKAAEAESGVVGGKEADVRRREKREEGVSEVRRGG